jgi:hypothetical protein
LPTASTKRQPNYGRYASSTAPVPPAGLGSPPSHRVRTAIATIDDPMDAGRKQLATVNRDVDVLENELSHRRIDHAAYMAGQELRRAYERLPAAASGSNWRGGDRIDAVAAQSAFVERLDDAARAVAAVEERARRVIGASGVAFLSRVLRDGMTFGQLATLAGRRGSPANVAQFGDRFRWLLGELADGWSAKGKGC